MDDAMTGAAERRLAELEALVSRLGDAAATLRQERDAARERALAMEQELARTEARLLVETMHSAGLAAQATHLLAVGADAALAPAEGEAEKTVLTLIYERAFDAKGAELGVPEPSAFRA
ncbi:hypothetical protein [Pseudoroseomonas cervicalis]|uniref:hypothetical protein n=1 Tax=Teichococcus cervicalis TaxID=204525 RepID=UPI0022F175CC|nr:hypothetical protein [Pseudoroseomonas cervicalis]WBV43545.1 hypothetical protein PFY06_02985 [Pseudoroseomonas cervicalis]